MSDKDAVSATLEDYADAYCAKDLDRPMTVFVDSGDVSLIGTGNDELCSTRDEIAAVFSRSFRDATASRFEWIWRDVAIHGQAATVAASLNIHLMMDGSPLTVPIRWTVSLIKTGGLWNWVHRHAAAAAGSQDDGAAYPIGDD